MRQRSSGVSRTSVGGSIRIAGVWVCCGWDMVAVASGMGDDTKVATGVVLPGDTVGVGKGVIVWGGLANGVKEGVSLAWTDAVAIGVCVAGTPILSVATIGDVAVGYNVASTVVAADVCS